MRESYIRKNLAVFGLVWVMLMMPIASMAQTKVGMPKNKYKVQDDVKIGVEYSAKVEQEFPILRDRESARYLEIVGQRLVSAIPGEFQQPAFRYSFKIVNARDINAFALPGGPMYVNRGLIQVAKNEGEMAGVMAHEISHVALRHGTAQATRQSSLKNRILGGILILGGAVLGGQAGAQLGAAIFQGTFVLKYSRRYENQADILGARIMANAGYDPRDLANMFRTINQQSKGGRPPAFLSSHPNPEDRYRNVNNEARLLRVSANPIKYTRGFAKIREKLGALPPARSMADLSKDAKNRQGASGNTGGNTGGNSSGNYRGMTSGKYARTVQVPSTRTRSYANGNLLRMRIPRNWRQFPGQNDVWFAPNGAYGNRGITHGATVGLYSSQQRGLRNATQEYVRGILQSNSNLRQIRGYSQTRISGRSAYATMLSGRSTVTGRTEYALIYTTLLRNGNMFYVVAVAPYNERYRYNRAFNNMVRSIRLYQ